jgi:hypothetical protein
MKKVVVRISGGLGNQMFGHAVAVALAKRTGRTLFFDLSDFLIFYGGRQYQLNNFVGPSRVRNWNLLSCAAHLLAWVAKKKVSPKVYALAARAMSIHNVRGKGQFELDRAMLDDRAGLDKRVLYLDDVYAVIPYLPDEQTLRDEFRFVNPPCERNRLLAERFENSPSVSIHIRRSDYLGISGGAIVLDFEYYRRAIERILQVEKAPTWAIFSDDIAWCRDAFAFLGGACFVEGNESEPWEDLRLMAACKHHIIANSTFSWWGAYLGRDRSGLTVVPDPLFPTLATPPTFVRDGWVTAPAFSKAR